jgi:bifunctional oligoribonuclease and PAP phosphatase NrnA
MATAPPAGPAPSRRRRAYRAGCDLVTSKPAVPAPTEADWEKAAAALAGSDEIVLACHVSPDGDALGSMLALAHALRRRGGRVLPSFGAPFTVPESLRVLPGLDLLVPPTSVPAAPRLLVTFDTGSVDRLGTLADRVAAAAEVLVIDHHASNTGYGTLHLVDPAAPATAVLVTDLVDRLGVPLDTDIAACAYAGLVTDTGSFRFAGTTPATHELAARLLATGIRQDLLGRELFDSHPFGWLPMVGAVLARARLEPAEVGGLGLVWTETRLAELTGHGLGTDQAESLIDLVRTAREAEIAAVFKELPDGRWAVSLRSKGRVDVGAVCVALGGGGHRFAAGFTSSSSPDGTLPALRAALAAAPWLPADPG